MSDGRVLQRSSFGRTMPPIWPFGKKKEPDQLDEEPPAPIMYKMGESASQQTLADETHKNSNDYKSALALFGGGGTEVSKAEDQSSQYDGIVSGDGQGASNASEPAKTSQKLPEISARTEAPKQVQATPPSIPSKPAPPKVPTTPAFTWVHHTDGYHYKKKADGTFDAVPHVKNNSGSYIPYS
ncbi:MAG: hypothetical protein HOL72_02390 [Euryarchaeota archaeon]|jgi:hypothetical protein|nr:hypothetical protein [Euryarchaeota archaeon]MBT5254593.1 hypothetical protein [Euryarchaeota archaeon]